MSASQLISIENEWHNSRVACLVVFSIACVSLGLRYHWRFKGSGIGLDDLLVLMGLVRIHQWKLPKW